MSSNHVAVALRGKSSSGVSIPRSYFGSSLIPGLHAKKEMSEAHWRIADYL
jgi:hypothetical protein